MICACCTTTMGNLTLMLIPNFLYIAKTSFVKLGSWEGKRDQKRKIIINKERNKIKRNKNEKEIKNKKKK